MGSNKYKLGLSGLALMALAALAGCKSNTEDPNDIVTATPDTAGQAQDAADDGPSLYELVVAEKLGVEKLFGDFFLFTKDQTEELASDFAPKKVNVYTKCQELKPLLYNELKPYLINKPEVLEGIFFREGSCNLNVGCNNIDKYGGACGIGQIMKDGMAAAIEILFSNSGKYEKFRKKYEPQFSLVKTLVSTVTAEKESAIGYFDVLEEVLVRVDKKLSNNSKEYKKNTARVRAIEKTSKKKGWTDEGRKEYRTIVPRLREIEKENRPLLNAAQLIRAGYPVTYEAPKCKKGKKCKTNRTYEQIKREVGKSGLDDTLKEVTGIEIPGGWTNYVYRQREMINHAWSKMGNKGYAVLNMLLSDLILAYYTQDCKEEGSKDPLACGMEKYAHGVGGNLHAPVDRQGRSYSQRARMTTKDTVDLNNKLYHHPRLKYNRTDVPFPRDAARPKYRHRRR